MKPLVLVTAPIATRSGYGSHSRDIVHSLLDMNKLPISNYVINTATNDLKELYYG